MSRPPDNSCPLWVDSFVCETPPRYITEHYTGQMLETQIHRWRSSRRDRAVESLRKFLQVFSHSPPVDVIIRELEKNSPPDDVSLALKLRPAISSEDEFCDAMEIAAALADPISRASLVTRAYNDLASEVETLRQEIQEFKCRLSTLKTVSTVAITVLSFFLILGFGDYRYELTFDSPEPQAVRSSWWGLSKERTKVRWMTFKPKGEPFKAWCAQGDDAEWYPFLVDNLGFDDYE